MEYPVDEQDAREKVGLGRLIQGMHHNQGYTKLFHPFLLDLLDKADTKCHDYKIRTDRGMEAVVEYNTIKVILDFCGDIIENMKNAQEYLDDNNIKY